MNNRASRVLRRAVLAAGLVVSALSAAAGYTPVKSISAGAYVQRGLVAQWDGIEKAADVAADGWTDLKGGVTLGPNIPSDKSIVAGMKSIRLNGACLSIDSTTDEAAIALAKVFAGASKTVEIAGNGSADTAGRWLSVLENATDTDGGNKRIFLAFNGRGTPIDQLCLYGGKYALTGLGISGNTDFSASMAFTALGTSTTYLDGAAKGSTAVSPGQVDPQAAHINLGAIASVSPATGTKMEYHALRVYNVTLTPEEVRYNAWLDRVRFSNAELPEGLLVTEEGGIEAEVTVTFDETQGCVVDKGVAVQSGAKIRIPFVPGGGSALLTAEPKEGFCITGIQGESAVVDRMNGTIAVDMLTGYLADGSAVPSELEVTFGNASEHISSGAYVQQGIVVHYDAIDNAGLDSHAETLTSWKNLAAGASDLTLPDGAVVGAKAIQFGKARGTATDVTCARSTEEITAQLSARTLEDYSAGSVEQIIFDLNGRLRTGYDGGKNNHVGLCVVMPKNADLTAINTHEMYWYGSFMWDEYARDRHSISVTGPIGAPTTSSVYLDSANFKANGITYSYGNVAAPDGKLYIGDAQYSHAFNAVRLYDRKLTKDEILFNAWVDDVRFSDGKIPEGVVVTPAGLLEIKLKVKFDATRGSVSVGGAAIQSGDDVTFAIADGAVHLTAVPADGYVIQAVEGAPADIDRTEGALAVSVLSDYIADGAPVPSVLEVKFVKPSPAVSEKSYVQRGLTAQWDGIVKDADVAANGWSALKGGVTLRRMTDAGSIVTKDKYVRLDGAALWDNGDAAVDLVHTLAKNGVTFEIAAYASLTLAPACHLFMAQQKESDSTAGRVFFWYDKTRAFYHGGGFWASGMTDATNARFTEFVRTTAPTTVECGRNGERKAGKDGMGNTLYTGATGSILLNALCKNNGAKTDQIDYYGIRVYDAKLTDDELLFNSNLDRMRFDGVDGAALTWPEGFRCVADWVEAKVTVTYDETQGTLLDANGDPVRSGVATWVPADGAEVKLTLDADEGMVVTSVDGVPAVVDYANDVITLSATGNVTCAADIARRGPAIDENSYVQRGLVAQWDGIVKDADVAANGWTDLKGGVTFRRMADTGSVVTDDKYVRVDGEALWDNGDGAANVVRTVSKPGVTFEVVAKTSATTPFVFSAAKEEENTAESNRILLWYNGARTMYHASGTYPGFWTTGITPTKGVRNTEVLRYPLPSTAEFLLNGEFKGKKADLSSMAPYTGETGSVYLSALCRSNGVKDGPIDYYGIRVYDATLTDKEIKFNSDLDKVRFDGDDPAKIAWPEGVRYRGDWLEAQVTVAYDETRGTVLANGQPVASNVTTWVAIDGGAVKLTLVDVARGMGMTAVEGAPADIDLKKGEAVLIPFGRPSVTVRIEPLIASEVMYVQRGLVAHWDGVKKAADVATDGWTDLKAGVTLGPRIPDGGSIVTAAKGVNLHGASLYIDSTTDAAAIAVERAFAGAQKTIEIAGNGEGAKEDKWVSVLTGKDPSAGTYLFLWYNGGNGGVALDTLLLRGASGKFPRTGLRLVNNTDFTAALAFAQVGTFTPYQGGVAMSPELATAVELVTPNEAHINLGAFGSGKDPQTGTKMEFHALRVYNVTLTQTEVAFNAAVDQVRFSNVSPADADWPEGISYNAEKGELEVEVTVTYGEALGSVTVNGVSVRSGVPTKVPYNMGIATVAFAPAGEFVSLKSISAGGKKIPATDNQATVDDLMSVRTIRAKISGGGMRLIVR